MAGAVQTEILLIEVAVTEGAAGQEVILTANFPGSQVLAQPMTDAPMPEIQAGAMEPVAGRADAKANLATKQVDAAGAGVPTTATSEIIAAQPGSLMEADAQAALQSAQPDTASRSAPATMADQQQNIATALAAAPAQAAAAQTVQNPQAMAGARKPAPPAPAGDAVEATKPSESLALLSNALNNIQAAREMQVVMADETAEPGLRLAQLEAPKAAGTKPSGESRAEGVSMQPPAFMGPDGMLQRADAPLPSSPAREASAPLPARQLAPVVVSLVLGRGDEALTIALDPVELGRVEVSIGQGKEAGREVIFSPVYTNGMIQIRMPKGLIPRISMSPESPLVRSKSRHPISEAGADSVVDRLRSTLDLHKENRPDAGQLEVTTVVEPVVGQVDRIKHVTSTGETWVVDMDSSTGLPLTIHATDPNGQLLEHYEFRKYELNRPDLMTADAFDPNARWGQASLFGKIARSGSNDSQKQ